MEVNGRTGQLAARHRAVSSTAYEHELSMSVTERHWSRTRPAISLQRGVQIPLLHSTSATFPFPSTMYVAGIMDHFSDAPRMELIVWGSTVGMFTSFVLRARSQVKGARSRAGSIKPACPGPRLWTSLALLGQFGGIAAPPLIYWTTTAHNGFKQPEWIIEYALPSPPDVFGADGVMVGRTAGLLAFFAGGMLIHSAVKALGDQFHAIGVSDPIFAWITNAILRLSRAVDKGAS